MYTVGILPYTVEVVVIGIVNVTVAIGRMERAKKAWGVLPGNFPSFHLSASLVF